MSNKKYIDIIIPTKDRNDKLERCLTSLSRALDHNLSTYFYNVIVVKEHSSKRVDKEFFNILKHPNFRFLNISYIVIKHGEGFTKAINTGLLRSLSKKHKPDYIGFLHDDTVVFKNWLESLMKPMEEDIWIYGTGGITVNELDEQCISKTHTLFGITNHDLMLNEFYEVTPDNNFHIADRMKPLNYYKFEKDPNKGMISLFSCLFRKEAFEKFGLFDENLISSFRVEDEYCKRLMDNGKRVALVPQAFSMHECFRLSFGNKNIINDKIMRDATLHNIKIKRQLNPIISQTKHQYVVYTHMECVNTPKLNNIFNFHDKKNVSFICFSERDKILGETWEIVNIHPFLEIEEFKKNRKTFEEFVKLHPHYFFSNFNTSMWLDFESINMCPFDVEQFIRLMDKSILFMSLESNKFNCSWKYLMSRLKDEGLVNTHRNPMLAENGEQNTVLSTYRFYNFPQDAGFMDTSVFVVKHNNPEAITILNKLWKNYITIAKDDKLWFNFMLWLHKKSYYSIPFNVYQMKMNEVNKEIEELKKSREEKHND